MSPAKLRGSFFFTATSKASQAADYLRALSKARKEVPCLIYTLHSHAPSVESIDCYNEHII